MAIYQCIVFAISETGLLDYPIDNARAVDAPNPTNTADFDMYRLTINVEGAEPQSKRPNLNNMGDETQKGTDILLAEGHVSPTPPLETQPDVAATASSDLNDAPETAAPSATQNWWGADLHVGMWLW